MIMKKFEFNESYKFENYSGINEVYCDSKTFLNKLGLMLLMVVHFISIINVVYTFINVIPPPKFTSRDSEDLFIAIFGFIVFFIPTILLLLKVVNFKFYINNNNVIYKNWIGKEKNYFTSEIKKVYLRKGNHHTYITIEFNDTVIDIAAGDRNFQTLKKFLGL